MSATQEPKIWFALLGGKQRGPYTFTALVLAAESGHLDPEASVCRLGWDEWRIARDVPGLFKPEPEPDAEPEPEPAAVDQEQDVDSREEDTGDLEESDYLAKVNLKGKDDRAAARQAATDAFMASKPLVAHEVLYETVSQDATIKGDEGPSLGLSAGRAMSVSPLSVGSKPNGRSRDVWIVIGSVLAVLVVAFGAGWAATSAGIIRVTLLF